MNNRITLVGVLVLAFAGGALFVQAQDLGQGPAQAQCSGPDCIAQSLSSQARCTQEQHGAVGNSVGWLNGLNTNVDQRILGGDVVAYQIEWSSGWSGWYVTGVNDIDWKFNPGSNQMRRVWSYFGDHNHRYIICR